MLDVDDVIQVLGLELLGVIPEDSNMVSYINRGEPAVLDKNSISGQAMRNIAERLIGKKVPFIDLKSQKGLIERIKGIFNGRNK